MLDYIHREVVQAGILPAERVVVVHADLGKVEWQGVKELAAAQAAFYGFRFEVVRYRNKAGQELTLLDHVRARKAYLVSKGSDAPAWPDSSARYCTSDHKRGPVQTLWTRLAREAGADNCLIVNTMGLRGQESKNREKLAPWKLSKKSNSKKTVWEWLPIHDWKVDQVWATIKASGCPYHWAYDAGMPRLSCCFCVFAPKAALLIAAKHNPELLEEYVQVEREVGSKFTARISLATIQQEVAQGGADGVRCDDDGDWCM